MRYRINTALLAALLLSTFFVRAQTATGTVYPRVKLYITNGEGSKIELLQAVNKKTVIVDSGTVNSANSTIELKGSPINEEQWTQLCIRRKDKRMFVAYPVLDNNRIPEVHIDLVEALSGKGTYLEKFRYENSPSSVDWSTLAYFPVQWKKPSTNLKKQFKNSMTAAIQKQIDSLERLTKDYRVAMIKKTKSVVTVCAGLNYLKFDYPEDDFGDLLKETDERFPESQAVQNTLKWFRATKKYIPPGGEVIDNGTSAIDFSFVTNKGTAHKLSDYKGSYVLLDFWASWCKPCRDEAPYLKQAFLKYGNKGIKIVQVSIDNLSDEVKWKKAIEDDGTQGFVHSRKDKNDLLIKQYKITAIPVNYLIDPTGKIIASNLRGDALEAKLKEIYPQ